MNDDKYTIESGHVDVGDDHTIYYQRWGNPDGFPIFALHGGPGSQSKDKHKLAFDPKKHQVIFHDQRGCGQSSSVKPLEHNTTNDLVHDIEILRSKFEFNKVHLYGHSWGSTLALYYAIHYPANVAKMMIGGVYTAMQEETDHLYQGGLKAMFPEAWERFIGIIPVEERHDTIKYYERMLTHGSEKEKLDHLRVWSQLEPAPMSIDADYSKVLMQANSIEDLESLPSVLVGIHYFKNGCFMPERFILDNLEKIQRIPMVITQGRFDNVCLTYIAQEVADAIGDNCHLHVVPASHAGENALREVQRAYTWSFLG